MKLYTSTAMSDGLPCVTTSTTTNPPPLPPPCLLHTSIMHPSIILSILKGTPANLIIDSPDAAVLRRGCNNLLSLRRVWPRASSALADKWGRRGGEWAEKGIKKLYIKKEKQSARAQRGVDLFEFVQITASENSRTVKKKRSVFVFNSAPYAVLRRCIRATDFDILSVIKHPITGRFSIRFVIKQRRLIVPQCIH